MRRVTEMVVTLAAVAAFATDASADKWFPVAPPSQSRAGASATLLPNGKVLLLGGYDSSLLDTAELFDPASNTWTTAAPMLTGRTNQTATLLSNGDLLVVGGDSEPEVDNDYRSAEMYDSVNNTWTSISTPAELQVAERAVLLQSGQVLLLGRFGTSMNNASQGAAIYNPVTSTWRMVAPPNQSFGNGTPILLANGNVLFIGGYISEEVSHPFVEDLYTVLNSVEIYDPLTDTWSTGAPMQQARAQETATLLSDGNVLVTGGAGAISTGSAGHGSVASVEIYDPQSDTWSSLAPMHLPRVEHTATLLSDGDVLVAGGSDCGPESCLGFGGSGDCCAASSAEIYEPATNTWSLTEPVTTGDDHLATALPGGGVLVIGGSFLPLPMPDLDTAEIYASHYAPDEPPLTTPGLTYPPPIPPRLGNVSESHRTWRISRRVAGTIRNDKHVPVGTMFSFSLSEPANVNFSFSQRVNGRLIQGRCVTQTKKNKHKRACGRAEYRGAFSIFGHAGENRLVFKGKIPRSTALPSGRYLLELTAANSIGAPSNTALLSFTIVG
jgi:N-acetylneuraminic acid mutarotase